MPPIFNSRRMNLPFRVPLEDRKNKFYDLRLEERQGLDSFLTEFQTRWEKARCGVSAKDGMIQLVRVLPPEWQGWASSLVLDRIEYGGKGIYGAQYLREIINAIKERFQMAPAPPAGDYPTYDRFCSIVYQPSAVRNEDQPLFHPKLPDLNLPIIEPNLEPVDSKLPIIGPNQDPEESIGSNPSFIKEEEVFAATAESGDLSSTSAPKITKTSIDLNFPRQPVALETNSPQDIPHSPIPAPLLEFSIYIASRGDQEPIGPYMSSYWEPEDNQEEFKPMESAMQNEEIDEEETEPEEGSESDADEIKSF